VIAPKNPSSGAGLERWLVVAPGILALVPFVAYHGMFNRLFWFGDEFDMIDQIDRIGFWRWTCAANSENFIPLFKALWGGAVLGFHGSYASMTAILWATHALNVILLGRLLRTSGLPRVAVVFAQVVFGLTPANLETLAWTVQWSSMLSVTFMLRALEIYFRRPFGWAPIIWAIASPLSFVRGMLTGPMLAVASLLEKGATPPVPFSRRLGYGLLCLLPAVLVAALVTWLNSGGQARPLAGHWGEVARYGAWYYFLNPAFGLVGRENVGPPAAALSALLKVGLIGWALCASRGHTRALFTALVVFDILYAVLLGIGRHHLPLPTALSSRYQYASLVASLPAAGFCLSRLGERLPFSAAARTAAISALVAAIAVAMCLQWRAPLDTFTRWRGTDSRRIFLGTPGPEPQEVPGFPAFPMERARELVAKYHLH
jgi:hypothetical protein